MMNDYESDMLITISDQIKAQQKQIDEMHAFCLQLAETLEQFQKMGPAKMIMGMMGGK